MLARYSHVRIAAKGSALDGLSRTPDVSSNGQSERDGHVTNHVTYATNPPSAFSQVVEKYGRPVRTRTADLYPVNAEYQVIATASKAVGDCQVLDNTPWSDTFRVGVRVEKNDTCSALLLRDAAEFGDCEYLLLLL
jgi:hypothetical protein